MPDLPSCSSYKSHANRNYGVNTVRVDIGELTVWFSYRTPIAFMIGARFVMRPNRWGPTTGRHMALLRGADRVSDHEFEALWYELVEVPGVFSKEEPEPEYDPVPQYEPEV